MARLVMVGLVFASVSLLLSSVAARVPDYDYLPDESITRTSFEDDEAYAPVTIEYGFPPEPFRGYYDNLDQCEDNVNLNCVKEIYRSMFKTEPLNKNCCKNLVQMGYGCHSRLAKLVNPRNKAKASMALAKSVQIWQKCVSVVETGRFPAVPAPF
ncbi:putative Prolamin-like domain-containing protein [Rosa chinensis]|uniref:Putative Prolamin-like domain-containing protein n=1 Tax=Rosa chinensis TaxID=74649 RepID=A0A2P6QKW9_ROSCH|nr:uncharacterized protein LOC112164168 [Rosa chinensis]PRQ34817.1 putative Prolamin-like domain-containing protein [Rosa chinensis]